MPPQPEALCKAHQDRVSATSQEDYDATCNYHEIQEKAKQGTLKLSDLIPCYYPDCEGRDYAIRQCSYNAPEWCWCSDREGIAIEGTLQKGLKADGCSK